MPRRGEISSTIACSLEFRNYRTLYQHIVAVHPNFFVDNSIPQDESPEKLKHHDHTIAFSVSIKSKSQSTACMEKKIITLCSTLIGNNRRYDQERSNRVVATPFTEFILRNETRHVRRRAKKVEALINSPEISSLIKESLRSKFDRANELAAGFSELIPKRTLDKNNALLNQCMQSEEARSLLTLRSTPSRLAYQSNKRAESTECMEKKSSPMCSTIGVDNDETNLSNQRSSNGEKIDGTKIFDHNVNCSPQQQSSSIESMNKSSQALADSNDDNSSVDLSRSLLQQEENRKILKDYDYQYRRLDLIVKTLMDKKASKLTLHRLTQEVKRVLEDWLFPLNDNFYPLFLFDKDANVHFEFFILDPESPVTITNRSPCSDMRIFRTV
ncbi:hypothetical protein DERF_002713 [Dermatophagoides farinae]|uniref:Uncharacterized protein n=1 Tax=Dermatophagoides farinae TaxID=6954 RepID=A0A922IC68_DERFA|nr:hypothetical protein DERF_002713 [Dermatophagoides farinae]